MPCGHDVLCIRIFGPAKNHIGKDHEAHKKDRDHMTRGIGIFANEGNLRDEAAVLGLVHGFSEEHQQRGHEKEHREQAAEDGLDQGNAHIHAQEELHEGHGREACDGGQAAGKDLRNRGRQSLHHSVMDVQVLMLFLIAVTEDNGIVHRQSKLQHYGD